MGKLLIEPKTKFLIENSPEDFTQETIELYNKAVNEAEQSDEYTLIGVDLAINDLDYSAYTKVRLEYGKWILLEAISSGDGYDILKTKDGKIFLCKGENKSYGVKGGKQYE